MQTSRIAEEARREGRRVERHPAAFERIDTFESSFGCGEPGVELRLIREEARVFRARFAETGMPEYAETFDLVAVPYPRRFGLFRAGTSPSPFVTMTNRLIVIRWRDRGGGRKTLLFEPSDVELGENTPFYRKLSNRIPNALRSLGVRQYGGVLDHLRAIGVDPKEVDYVAFDHQHVQDVRRLVGTRGPAPDISPGRPVPPLFPNARLVIQRSELTLLENMHPLQSEWYQPETYRDLRDEALLVIDGDYLLGPGVALLHTPGHSAGNQTLVLNTNTGIWAFSENVIATELLTPESSAIPGVRRYAERWGVELILNGNTIEATARQYNSAVKEKSIVDRCFSDGRFLQFFPTSELTRNVINPGTAPTFAHRKLVHGALVREA